MSKKLSRRWTAVVVALVLALLAGAVALQYSLDDEIQAGSSWNDSGPFDTVRSMMDVLGGLRESVAAYFWTKTDAVFHEYLGGSLANEQSLYPYYWLTTKLDPHFAMPYYFASWMLCRFGKVDQGLQLALEGLRNNPDSSQLQENLASIYFFFLKDPRKARYHIQKAMALNADPADREIMQNFLDTINLVIAGKRRIPEMTSFGPAEKVHEEQHHHEEGEYCPDCEHEHE